MRDRNLTAGRIGLETSSILAVGTITLDARRGTLCGPAAIAHLSPSQAGLLERLLKTPNVVVSHDKLIDTLWRNPDASPLDVDRILKMQIHFVRKALAKVGAPNTLRNVPRCGYLFTGAKRYVLVLDTIEQYQAATAIAEQVAPAAAHHPG